VELQYQGDAVTGFAGEFVLKGGPLGFRTNSVLTIGKPAGVYRIFFMGGSTTACTYLPQEMTFAQLVEDQLNGGAQHAVPHYECANAGVDGSAARDTLTQLIYDVSFANPDCVVVMQGVNDFALGLTPDFAADADDKRTAKGKAKSAYEEFFGDPHWFVYQFYKALTRRHSKRFTLEHIREERERLAHLPRIELTEFPNLPHFIRYMKLITSSCKSLGIRPIFMTQCSLYDDSLPPEVEQRLGIPFPEEDGLNPSNASMKRGMDAYNNALRTLAAEEGIDLIDLDKAIPKTLEFLYDHVHFSVAGNRRVAEEVSKYLVERNIGSSHQ
jgi:lysophospholipase L1-like esterase